MLSGLVGDAKRADRNLSRRRRWMGAGMCGTLERLKGVPQASLRGLRFAAIALIIESPPEDNKES